MNLDVLIPVVTGLILVLVGVFSHEPTVRDVGLGMLAGGAVTGGVQRGTPVRG